MMYSYPYFHPPFIPPMYRRPIPRYVPSQSKSASSVESNPAYQQYQNSFVKQESSNSTNYQTQNESAQDKKENRASEDSPIFEIFGMKLYFDDLLLLGLLFFLYSEGVQDQELFFALVLLLLS